MILPLLLAVTLLAPPQGAPSSPPPAAVPAPAPPTAFESYQLVLLQRPEHPRDYPAAKLEEIQQAHLAHLRALAQAGKLLVAGPFDDQPDPRLRGLALFRVGSVAEAKRLASEDPAVQAGRLEAVVMTWYTEKGALAFPGVEKLRKP
jgi:uncharacterized protein YciI